MRYLFNVFLIFSLTVFPRFCSAESQWKKGALIGTSVGAVAGLGTGAATCGASENWDFGPCLALTGSTFAFLGGLVGFGTGALIGSTIEKEEVISKRERRSYALQGLGIGAVSGLAVGGGVAVAAATADCSLSGDPGDCSAIRGIVIVSALTGTPVLGGLIGLGIGSAMPREQKLSLMPSLYRYNNITTAVMTLATSF